MERTIYKPSVSEYGEGLYVEDVLKKYDEYISLLSDENLKGEYKNIRSAWLNSPTVCNVRMFEIAKQKMLERGLLPKQIGGSENNHEMYF